MCELASKNMRDLLDPPPAPVFRNLSQPLHARRLQANIRIEPPRDRAVNNRLFFLPQQLDQLLLCNDAATSARVGVIEKADNGGLFGRWGNEGRHSFKV